MKVISLIVTVGLSLLFVQTSFADDPGWVHDAEIDFITVQPNGRVYVKLLAAVPDLGCNGNEAGLLEFDTAASNYKELFSLMLSAHMANRKVTVYVSGCGGWYPNVQNTRVQ